MRTVVRRPTASRPAPMPVHRQRRRRLVGTPAGAYHPSTADDEASRGTREDRKDGGRAGERGRERRRRPPGTAPLRDVLRRPDVSPPESADEGPPSRDRPRPHELLDVLDIDRCSLGLFSADQRSLVIEHTATRPGVVSHKGKDFAVAFPWYTEELRRGHRLVFNFMVDELPPEAKAEREFAARTGLLSHTVLPVAVGDRILGALGVASVTKVRVWSREFLSRMELLAAVVGPGPVPPPRGGAHHGRRGAEPRNPPRPAERGCWCSTATGGSSP